MQDIILFSTFFGPIDYFAHIAQSENILIEIEEHYKKQSYRNRCSIYGANGRLDLNVPVRHRKSTEVRRKTRDTKVANEFDWQKLHWKSIKSAYQTSPYFEFYEDELRPIYEKKHNFLLDLNMESLNLVQDILQESWKIEQTKEYFKSPEGLIDLRSDFSPKKNSNIEIPSYTQVFSNKLGYISNLSILDLIFMEGPNTLNVIQGIDLKK